MFALPRRFTVQWLFAAAISVCFTAAPAVSALAVVIPPAELSPGSQYQIVFVTKAGRDASSGGFATYNTFVSQQAAQNVDLPATTWWAVASTGPFPIVAQQNAKVYADIPIYNTAGQLVAANGTDFYSAIHLAPIAYDQFGDYKFSRVWTGMYPNGNPDQYLDFALPGTTYGVSDSLDGTWARYAASSNRLEILPLYGLSAPITAVPEPSTWVMGMGWVAILVCGAFRRRIHHGADGEQNNAGLSDRIGTIETA